MTVGVSLLSGKTVSVETAQDASVHTLLLRAQAALGVGRGRLLDSSGIRLPEQATVKEAGLHSQSSLTLQVGQVQVRGVGAAFAAILGDGSVETWGDAYCGGDSSALQDQLENVQQIQSATHGSERKAAFAAILGDGSVVTWGDARGGGDSSAVQDQLKNVQQVQASDRAFAAMLGDGSVVTWGDARYGGDSNCARSAEVRAADPGRQWSFCCDP